MLYWYFLTPNGLKTKQEVAKEVNIELPRKRFWFNYKFETVNLRTLGV